MLKTNSKKAKENIKNYIIENFDFSSYEGYEGYEVVPTNYNEICNTIYNTFYKEKVKGDKRRMSEYGYFVEWCQGLPTMLDTCYYYNRSAINDLMQILEETEAEANKFTEAEAEEKLTYLLYREITKNM